MQEIESKIKESKNNTKNYIGWVVLVVDLWFAQIYDINIKFPNIFLEKFKKIKNRYMKTKQPAGGAGCCV